MKKFIVLLLLLASVLVMTSCSDDERISSARDESCSEAHDRGATKTVIGETTKGTPIVEYHNSGIRWEDTDRSSCFSRIGYDADAQTVGVVFRDSGAKYIYEDVPASVWSEFRSAESIGGYYNKHIKNYYDCSKIAVEEAAK